jgi:hypothetical protein
MDQILERAKARLLEAARAAQPNAVFDSGGYASRLEDNLIKGVCRSHFETDYRAGAGRELGGKMRAAHSSAALVVNTFAPWRDRAEQMTIAGLRGFSTLRFEAVYPTGLGGTPPHLDVAVEGACTVAVESKLVEYLTPKIATFSPAYDTIRDCRSNSPWFGLIPKLRDNPAAYRYLDAAQLVKHALGLMRGCPQAVLVYLYWEPRNWREVREFREHREEIAHLQRSIGVTTPAFHAMTYGQLWEEWLSDEESDGWVGNHVDRLRQRYDFAI